MIKTEKLNSNIAIQQYDADIFVVVAYGVIFPKRYLAIPQFGTINLHPSLLPKYRGASPIQAAILAGENTTGVTIMLLDEKFDHGPILWQEVVPIEPHDTTESLLERLANVGAKLLLATIPLYIKGTIRPQPQDHSQASITHRIAKEDGKINWGKSAVDIERMVRAFYPWPGAWTTFEYKGATIILRILRASTVVTGRDPARLMPDAQLQTPGMIIKLEDNTSAIVCGNRTLLQLNEVQPEGRRPMNGEAFLNGYREVVRFQ